MNGALVDAMLGLGLAVVVVRRRSVAIALLAAQSLALGIGALSLAGGRSGESLVAGFVLLSKAIVIPLLLYALIRRTREPGLVLAAAGPLVRLACASAAVLCAVILVPPLGLGDAHTEHAAVALVLRDDPQLRQRAARDHLAVETGQLNGFQTIIDKRLPHQRE